MNRITRALVKALDWVLCRLTGVNAMRGDNGIDRYVASRIVMEKHYALSKYGNDDQSSDEHWCIVLMGECAEVAKDVENGKDPEDEVTQVAAAAVAWLEAIQKRRGIK